MNKSKIFSAIQDWFTFASWDKQTDEFNYLKDVVEFYKEFIRPYKGNPRGCRDSEIQNLENHFGFELPLAYKEYLRFMGKDYNGIFIGSEYFIDDVVENTEYLPELLVDNKINFRIPHNYLAFFSHQGYMIAWFELPKLNENPPVWFYKESENNEPPKMQGTFTELLLEDMKGLASTLK